MGLYKKVAFQLFALALHKSDLLASWAYMDIRRGYRNRYGAYMDMRGLV